MTFWRCLLLMCLTTVLPAMAEDIGAPEPQLGSISGTVLDVYGDLVPGASVTLQCPSPCVNQTATANDDAAFNFRDLKFGIPTRFTYPLTVSRIGPLPPSSSRRIIPFPSRRESISRLQTHRHRLRSMLLRPKLPRNRSSSKSTSGFLGSFLITMSCTTLKMLYHLPPS